MTNQPTAILGPEWLASFVRDLLNASETELVTAHETGRDEQPLALIAASPTGVVLVDFDEDDDPEVVLLRWRDVASIRIRSNLVGIRTPALSRPANIHFETAEAARDFASRLHKIRA